MLKHVRMFHGLSKSSFVHGCTDLQCMGARVLYAQVHRCTGSQWCLRVCCTSSVTQALLHNDLSLQVMLADHFDRTKSVFR